MGAPMHQRGRLPLHGSAIRLRTGRPQYFWAPRGSANRRWRQLSANGAMRWLQTMSASSLPGRWKTPLAAAGLSGTKALGRGRSQNRRRCPCLASGPAPCWKGTASAFTISLTGTPLPLSRLYLLETTEDEHFEIIRLQGMEKMEALSQNTYRLIFFKWHGAETVAFSDMRCLRVQNHDEPGAAAGTDFRA